MTEDKGGPMEWAIRYDHGAVGTITLTNPDRLNAFTGDDMLGLRDHLRSMASDRGIRAVILTGAGRAFCAGGDLNSVAGAAPRAPEELFGAMREMVEVVELLSTMPKLTIAAVNGACAGAGLSLAVACDLRVAVTSSVFLSSFAKVGQSGDYGQAWFLERLVGSGWARRMQLLSERVDPELALRIGLVEEVVEDDDLHRRTLELAMEASSMAPTAIAAIKGNLDDASQTSLSSYLDVECRRFVENLASDDAKEAVAAFIEDRPPRFN